MFSLLTSLGAIDIQGLPVSTTNSVEAGRRMRGALIITLAKAITSLNCLRTLKGIFMQKHKIFII
jgi:hypothetical protein